MSLEFSNISKKGTTVQKWSQIKANLVHSSVYIDKCKGASNRLVNIQYISVVVFCILIIYEAYGHFQWTQILFSVISVAIPKSTLKIQSEPGTSWY